MVWWEDILDLIGLVAAVVLVLLAYLFVRRRALSRGGVTFECSTRLLAQSGERPRDRGHGWTLGLGRYSGDAIEWFRIFSFDPRPGYVFQRPLEVTNRRVARGAEAFSLYSGTVVVAVDLPSGATVELAMSQRALTGFLAWTKASPPGHERLLS